MNTEGMWTTKGKKGTALIVVVLMLLAATAVQAVGLGQIDSEGTVTGLPGGFAGTVLDYTTGLAVEGATVQVFNTTGDVLEGEVMTDSNGGYNLVTGSQGAFNDTFTYDIVFNHDDYNQFTAEDKTVGDGDTYYVNVSLVPFYSHVTGTVYDALTGQPIVMAMVTVHEENFGQNFTEYTDNEGKFTISIMDRAYRISVMMMGYEAYMDMDPVGLPINSTDDRDLPMSREVVAISGTVTGSVVADAKVMLKGLVDYKTTTNETGWYSFAPVWGDYGLEVIKSGFYYHAEDMSLPIGADVVKDVVLSRMPAQTAEVFGYVKDNTTKLPIIDAKVCLVDTDSGKTMCDYTSKGGYFNFDIYAGYFEVRVTAVGYKPHSSFVSIIEDETVNVGDIYLVTTPPKDNTLSGTVTGGGGPVAGAMVAVLGLGTVATDAAGNYSIMVYDGTFDVEARAIGFFPMKKTSISVTADKDLDFDLTAVPPSDNSLYGWVKDLDGKPIAEATVELIDVDPAHGGFVLNAVTEGDGYYSFDIYDGEFLLIVDADGFNAVVMNFTLTADKNRDVTLEDSGQEPVDTYIVLENWDNITYKIMTELSNDVMLVRYNIDADKDGTVSQAEVDAWLLVEKDKGPMMKDTEDMFEVDGTFYGLVTDSFDVVIEGATGSIYEDEPITLTKTAAFTATEAIESAVNHTVKYNASFDTDTSDRTAEVVVPEGWEARNITSEHVAVSGTFTVAMDPPMAKSGLTYELVMLNVTGNSPPEADAGRNRTIKVDTNETFDAVGSDDDFGIINYTWHFGDGEMGYGVEVVHMFSLPSGKDYWNYTIMLNVTDTAGVVNSTTIWVLVDGAPPTALFTSNKTTTDEDGDDVLFNASQSKDNVGITNYTWDFDDGRFGYGMEVSHNWTHPGKYNVTLNVTDEAGWWANHTVAITVVDVTDPLAKITYLNSTPYFVEDIEYVVFNGSKSTDNVGVVSYEWDFGDGTTGSSEEVQHNFSIGKYNVTLTVKDDAGNSNTSSPYVIEAKSKPKVPDLEVVKIWTDPEKFRDGDKIMIKVTIENKGDGDVEDFTVQFSYKNTKIDVVRRQSVAAHDKITVSLEDDWKAKEGDYKICGEADWDNRVGEKDETNNKKCTDKIKVGTGWKQIGMIAALIVIVIVVIGAGAWRSRAKKEEKKERLRRKKKR